MPKLDERVFRGVFVDKMSILNDKVTHAIYHDKCFVIDHAAHYPHFVNIDYLIGSISAFYNFTTFLFVRRMSVIDSFDAIICLQSAV